MYKYRSKQSKIRFAVIGKREIFQAMLVVVLVAVWTTLLCRVPMPKTSPKMRMAALESVMPILAVRGKEPSENIITYMRENFFTLDGTAKIAYIMKGNMPFFTNYNHTKGVYNAENADVPNEKNPNGLPPAEKSAKAPIRESKLPASGLSVKNETLYKVDVESILSEKPSFIKSANEPLVLVLQTHASEAYSGGGYAESDTDRTQDKNFNMVRVGAQIAKQLEAAGIGVIHDRKIHDYPSYNLSYKESLASIEAYLKKYPSIQIVLDIHRDAVIEEDGTKIKFVADVGEKKVAQVMAICGTDQNGLEFDGWENNLRFAMQIQNKLETDFPGFARPLNLRKERFNLHKTSGSLLFEIGTNGNTLEEALGAADILGGALGEVINELAGE